jgi:inosose dehydratase
MNGILTRRAFAKTVALGLTATAVPASRIAALLAQKSRTVRIGHTGITWPGEQIDQAIRDIAALGFYGFETFGATLQQWESKGGLRRVLDENKLPLISAYCSFDMTDPAKRKDAIAQLLEQARLLKKNGGRVAVLGPNSVRRQEFNFNAAKSNIIAAVNEASKALVDLGVTPVFHQHTGTCVETREETYAVMEAVDTRYVKFGPDIGQLQKGGSDPVQVVKDFLSITHHMHLKDFNGGGYYLGYCPLGEGKVNIPAILDIVEGRKIEGMVMVELDGQHYSPDKRPAPETPLQAAAKARNYLVKSGVRLRA